MILFQIGFPGNPTVTPVRDDLEIVFRVKRRSESLDEISGPDRITGNDAQMCELIRHDVLRASMNADARPTPADIECKPVVNSLKGAALRFHAMAMPTGGLNQLRGAPTRPVRAPAQV